MAANKPNVVYVVQHDDGWAVRKPKAERASGVFDTQQDAVERAKQLAGNGTVHIQGRHGKLRSVTPFRSSPAQERGTHRPAVAAGSST